MLAGLLNGGSDDWRDHHYYFVDAATDIQTYKTLNEAKDAAQREADYETIDITVKHARKPVLLVKPRTQNWRFKR